MRQIIFLAGIHGVGKSTLAKQLTDRTGIECFSASDLIRAEKNSPVDKSKSVLDPDSNQSLLLDAITTHTPKVSHFILDGHFTLWNNDKIFKVPLDVFEQLPLAGILILTNSSELIRSRLNERDDVYWELADISQKLKEEIDRGLFIAHSIGLPIKILDLSKQPPKEAVEWVETCLQF